MSSSLLSPATQYSQRLGVNTSVLRNPLLMNIVCIGIPIFITIFYSVLAALFFSKHRFIIRKIQVLERTLNELSSGWRPNDPIAFDHNSSLFGLIEEVLRGGNQLFSLFTSMTISWTIISILLMTFFTATTIAVSGLMYNSLQVASGNKSALSTSLLSKIACVSSCDLLETTPASIIPPPEFEVKMMSPGHLLRVRRLRRDYFALLANYILVTSALALVSAFGVLLTIRARMILQGNQALAPVVLLAGNSSLISVALFLQTLGHAGFRRG